MAFANAALAGETPPLLGVCLGHQAIGLAAGWKLGPTEFGAVHGVPDGIIFDGEHEIMTRYHSLALTPTNDLLQIIATDSATDSLVMGVTHPLHSVTGVQFHPESAGSVEGLTIFKDFLAQ
jgi:anthranilate/para-aminobenzoate synthase component II